ncbi:MAG: chalcone isomerase family protein [Burkholderiales bacterium]
MQAFNFRKSAQAILGAALLTAVLSSGAATVDAAGVKFQDRAELGATKLVLNGAGVRFRTIFKVYAAGLYLSRTAATLDDVIAAPGAKRITLVMLRDIEADQISRLFLSGIMKSVPPSEASRLTPVLLRLSEAVTGVRKFVPNDVLTIEFEPGVGTTFRVNGKRTGDTMGGATVFDAAMHIWMGADPADWALKDALLGKAAPSN